MGSFEENYHQSFLRALSEEEKSRIRQLHGQLDTKFEELVTFMARELGSSKAQAHEEAEQAIQAWEQAANVIGAPLNSDLRRLLADHFEIRERIVQFRDDAMERWDGHDYAADD